MELIRTQHHCSRPLSTRHPKGMLRAHSHPASSGREPGGAEHWAERFSKEYVPFQAALTHLGFWLKLHLHLLPASREKHHEHGQSGNRAKPFPMATPYNGSHCPSLQAQHPLVPSLLSIRRMPTVNRTTANTSPPILRLW